MKKRNKTKQNKKNTLKSLVNADPSEKSNQSRTDPFFSEVPCRILQQAPKTYKKWPSSHYLTTILSLLDHLPLLWVSKSDFVGLQFGFGGLSLLSH